MNDEEKERKLKQANDNVKYLESQLTPLVESNAKLKESIHALQFYMEQRRLDFAQLLSYQKERKLKINLSDMIDVYHWLKKDIENYLTQIHDLETENSMFKMFIQQQDEDVRKDKKDMNKIITNLELKIQEKEASLNQTQKDYEKDKEQLLKINSTKLEDIEQKNSKIIKDLIQEKEEINTKYKQLDEEYQQKQKKLKFELINQYDKQERNIQVEHQKQIKELNDQIQKLDIKNRQLLTELQGLKQDYSQVSQQSSSLTKANNKLTRQVENLLQTIKGARDEIQGLFAEKSTLQITVEQLKQQIEKHVKKESELSQCIKSQQGQFSDAREQLQNQISTAENQVLELKNVIQKKELCIEQLSEMNVKIDQTYQEKINKQRIKYEQLLYPGKVPNPNMLMYKDAEIQYDDFSIKDLLEDYEQQISQYSSQYESESKKLKKLEESFEEKQNAIRKQFDQQIKKITKDYEQKLMKEIKQQKLAVEEIHQTKQKEFDYQQNRHKNEIQTLIQDFINKTKDLRIEIDNLNTKIQEDQTIIDQLNQLINNQQDNLSQQKRSYEQQLEMLRSNHSIGKEQLTSAFEERFNNLQKELKELQIQKEEFTSIQNQDQKIINEQKKKIENLQQNIQQQKEENKQQSQLISEQNFIIDQLQQQIQRLNDQLKQLTNEIENSKQVYNIFRNTTMAIPRVYDDYNYKTEMKKATTNQLKFSRTKVVTRQANRQTNHNSSMNFIVSNGDQQLPKVRSTSTNQIKTTPRHHPTQQ